MHSASCCAPRESYTLHFINEESIAIVSLLESEVFERFPSLKIMVGHGGGAIPYQLARFEAWRSRSGNPERFRDAMRKLYYDTCVYNAEGSICCSASSAPTAACSAPRTPAPAARPTATPAASSTTSSR